MSDQTPELKDLEIRNIGVPRQTRNGNPFIEAETSEGLVVAFWGFGEEKSNITALQDATFPVVARCQVRFPSQPGRHSLWIPWSSPLFLSPANRPKANSGQNFDEEAARAELSRLGRVLVSVLDRIEGQVSNQNLVPRILRFSKDDNLVPRRIAAFMILVAELRNSAEHDRDPFTRIQAEAGRTAWQAVTSWLEESYPEE